MALGGSSKGGGNSNRGRPYGMMLLLAFGAAVFGVMVLHKLRERRIFNILINDKDRELMTLQLLLQKERVSTKEVKRKIEELKAKTYSLRTQKMELSNKLMEMQSMVASLKEEQRALELALEEKQKEIKMLREKGIDSSNENSQITALTELLKQKEAEIEEMKRHLENPINIWSVSTDDPSNPHVNLTVSKVVLGNGRNEVGESIEGGAISKDRQADGFANPKDAEASKTKGEDGSKTATEGTDRREILGEERLQKLANNQDGEGLRERGEAGEKNAEEGQGRGEVSGDGKLEKLEYSQDGEGFGMRGEKSNRYATEVVDSSRDGEFLKTKLEGDDTKAMDGKEHGISIDEQLEKLENSKDGMVRILGRISKDGMKLEKPNGAQNVVGSRARGEYGYRSKTNGKRRRITSKHRELEKTENSKDVGVSTGSGTFAKDAEEGKRWSVVSRGGGLERNESPKYHKVGLRMRDEDGERDTVIGGSNGKLEVAENSKYDEGLRRRINRNDQVDLKGNEEGVVSSEGRLTMPENTGYSEGSRVSSENGEERRLEGRKQGVVSTDDQLLEPQNPQGVENLRIKVTSADSDKQVGKEEMVSKEEQLGKPQNSEDGEGLAGRSVDGDSSGLATDTIEQKPKEVVRQLEEEEEASGVQKPIYKGASDNTFDGDEKAKDNNGNKEPENLEVAHVGVVSSETNHKGNTEDAEF